MRNNNSYRKSINSNNNDSDENDNDTFHDAIQVENVINDTYNNNRKPINNGFLQPVGKRKGAKGMMHEHEGVLYVQSSMPDPFDHLDSISLIPDPYSNKQWNQPNHHDYSKQDLYGPLKHVYNRKTYYGEQRLTLYYVFLL